MLNVMKLACPAMLIVLAFAALGACNDSGDDGADATPSAVPTESAGPTATPIDSSTWVAYRSDVYDTLVKHPAGWTIIPAERAWESFDDGASDFMLDVADGFSDPGGDILISVFVGRVEAGTTLEEWVEAHCAVNTAPCDDMTSRLQPIVQESSDQGVLIGFTDDTQAFIPDWAASSSPEAVWTDPAPANGGAIYVVIAWQPADKYNAQALVEEFSRWVSGA